MPEPDLQQLLDRIAAARDYAHDQARTCFDEAERAFAVDSSWANGRNDRAVAFRSIAMTLNVILELDPSTGDDYSTPPRLPGDDYGPPPMNS